MFLQSYFSFEHFFSLDYKRYFKSVIYIYFFLNIQQYSSLLFYSLFLILVLIYSINSSCYLHLTSLFQSFSIRIYTSFPTFYILSLLCFYIMLNLPYISSKLRYLSGKLDINLYMFLYSASLFKLYENSYMLGSDNIIYRIFGVRGTDFSKLWNVSQFFVASCVYESNCLIVVF